MVLTHLASLESTEIQSKPSTSQMQLSSPTKLYLASCFPSYLLRHEFYALSGRSCLKQSKKLLSVYSSLNGPLAGCTADGITWHPEKMLQNVSACMLLLLTLIMGGSADFRVEKMQGCPGVGKIERGRVKKQISLGHRGIFGIS